MTEMDQQRSVTLWSADGAHVTARRGIDDSVVISGQHLYPGRMYGTEITEFEYGMSIAADDVPRLLVALNAAPDADVLDALAAAGPDVVAEGETRWLARIGVESEFWSRHE